MGLDHLLAPRALPRLAGLHFLAVMFPRMAVVLAAPEQTIFQPTTLAVEVAAPLVLEIMPPVAAQTVDSHERQIGGVVVLPQR